VGVNRTERERDRIVQAERAAPEPKMGAGLNMHCDASYQVVATLWCVCNVIHRSDVQLCAVGHVVTSVATNLFRLYSFLFCILFFH
jgi:hypothetical protein